MRCNCELTLANLSFNSSSCLLFIGFHLSVALPLTAARPADTLSGEQKRLQEALFEVISSEASYQKSLSVLVRHFREEPTLCQFQSSDCIISKADYQDLFSNADKGEALAQR